MAQWNAAYEQAMWRCDRLQELEGSTRAADGWAVDGCEQRRQDIHLLEGAALDRIVGERTDIAEIRARRKLNSTRDKHILRWCDGDQLFRRTEG